METEKWRWMEDDFPFHFGSFLSSMLKFQGCLYTVVKVDGELPLPSSLAISKVP